jgi:hypothetical protein
MVVPLLEDAKIKLLGSRVKRISQCDWMRNLPLDLTRRLIARFQTTSNSPATIAAHFLSNEGRVKPRELFQSPGYHLSVLPKEPISTDTHLRIKLCSGVSMNTGAHLPKSGVTKQ